MRIVTFLAVAVLSVSSVLSQPNVQVNMIPLVPGQWSTAMSWDKDSDSLKDNPATIVAGELIIGDASSQYHTPNVRTYFRFLLPQHLSGKTILYASVKFVCSYGGNDNPMLAVNYGDISSPPSLEKNPDKLPLSERRIIWTEKNWKWRTGTSYNTPNLSVLISKFLKVHGPGEIVIIITNIGKSNSFKGIVSPAVDPKNAPVLIVAYIDQNN